MRRPVPGPRHLGGGLPPQHARHAPAPGPEDALQPGHRHRKGTGGRGGLEQVPKIGKHCDFMGKRGGWLGVDWERWWNWVGKMMVWWDLMCQTEWFDGCQASNMINYEDIVGSSLRGMAWEHDHRNCFGYMAEWKHVPFNIWVKSDPSVMDWSTYWIISISPALKGTVNRYGTVRQELADDLTVISDEHIEELLGRLVGQTWGII